MRSASPTRPRALLSLVMAAATLIPDAAAARLLPASAQLMMPRLPLCRSSRSGRLVGSSDTSDQGPFADEVWSRVVAAADEEAEGLGLEIASIRFVRGKLSVTASGGGVDQLQLLNRQISQLLDELDEESDVYLPAFLLEVTTPGVSDELRTDGDFVIWKGFEVIVELSEEWKKKRQLSGSLLGRDDEHVLLNQRGRTQRIPRPVVSLVRLPSAMTEPGDRG